MKQRIGMKATMITILQRRKKFHPLAIFIAVKTRMQTFLIL